MLPLKHIIIFWSFQSQNGLFFSLFLISLDLDALKVLLRSSSSGLRHLISSLNSLFEEREIAAVVTTLASLYKHIVTRLVLLHFGELPFTPGDLQRCQVILDILQFWDVPEADRHFVNQAVKLLPSLNRAFVSFALFVIYLLRFQVQLIVTLHFPLLLVLPQILFLVSVFPMALYLVPIIYLLLQVICVGDRGWHCLL